MADDIEKTIQIAAPIGRVWAALTDPEIISDWMGDENVQIDLKMGGKFRLFNGETTGTFMQIDKPKSLAYTWRQAEWDKDWPDSVVHWELEPVGRETQVCLVHSKLPSKEERESHDEGWDLYFLEPMQDWLESEG